MSLRVDNTYLTRLEKFDLGVQTWDERMELIRLARVGFAAERNLTKHAPDRLWRRPFEVLGNIFIRWGCSLARFGGG